jgi:hypothetical protein
MSRNVKACFIKFTEFTKFTKPVYHRFTQAVLKYHKAIRENQLRSRYIPIWDRLTDDDMNCDLDCSVAEDVLSANLP